MSRLHFDNFRSPASVLAFVGTCALGLAADLLTKAWAFRKLEMNFSAYELIPGWLHFETTVNQGAVFGLGQGQRWLFVGVSILAIGFLCWLFVSSERRQIGYHILLGMLLAGVLGNLYDRIMFGHVRDMIHALPGQRFSGTWQIPIFNYPAPPDRQMFPYIFNFADMLLCTGVFLMIVYSLFHKPATASTTGEHEAEASTSATSASRPTRSSEHRDARSPAEQPRV